VPSWASAWAICTWRPRPSWYLHVTTTGGGCLTENCHRFACSLRERCEPMFFSMEHDSQAFLYMRDAARMRGAQPAQVVVDEMRSYEGAIVLDPQTYEALVVLDGLSAIGTAITDRIVDDYWLERAEAFARIAEAVQAARRADLAKRVAEAVRSSRCRRRPGAPHCAGRARGPPRGRESRHPQAPLLGACGASRSHGPRSAASSAPLVRPEPACIAGSVRSVSAEPDRS
jgi:hypothetical protein